MKSLLADLQWRGVLHQSTDPEGMDAWLSEKPRTVYVGFDPTSDSLHVGSLLGLVTLRRFQQAGHLPIAVVGGATGMIGDPSGKSEERNLLSEQALAHNVEGLKKQMQQFLDFEGESAARLVNNYDWMSSWSYLQFLRDIGKNFPVNVMLSKDSVKSRLGRDEGGMSYTEFSYMLLQAFDFLHLHREYGCELQAGGSDQWGNITAGIDLARRMDGAQLFGVTWPLLTKSDGTKMGKTESGAIWLSRDKTSPYHFYQYWVNVDDADATKCIRMLTDLPHDEIEQLERETEGAPEKRAAQKKLAYELTRLVHGEEGLQTAQKATEIFFGAEIADLTDSQLGEVFADVPSQEIDVQQLGGDGLPLIDAFVAAGLSKSKGEARRTIQQGGAYVNNRRAAGVEQRLTPDDLASESTIVLRSGKKKYGLLRVHG